MLKNHQKITLFVLGLSLLSLPYAQAESTQPSLQVTISPEKQNYRTNEYPKLTGSVTDQAGNPVAKATVKVTTAKYGIWTSTNLQGKFVIDQKVTPDEGVNLFNVLVKKEGYADGIASTSFVVIGSTTTQTQSNPVTSNQVPTQASMMQLLDQAKQLQEKVAAQDKMKKELLTQQQSIQKQREIAYANLLKDITKIDQETLPNAPRNAFAAFIATVDEGVHAIYWSQFALTEKLSQDAHQAKLQALQNGMSPYEAMKVYQKKASITRAQLLEYNANIQIQHGLADKSVQDKFDKNGKLPRIADN